MLKSSLLGVIFLSIAGLSNQAVADGCVNEFSCLNPTTIQADCVAHGFFPIGACVQSVQFLMNAYHNTNGTVVVTPMDTQVTLWNKVMMDNPWNPTPPTCEHIAMDKDRGDGGEGTHGGH